MFEEEINPKTKNKPLDLEILSVFELEERISNLKEEIAACEAAILKKKSSLCAANALFGNNNQ